MSDNFHRNFEYVFYFLLNTYQLTEEGSRLEEPEILGFNSHERDVTKHGVRFDSDKRLFRRDAPANESLSNWGEYLKSGWKDICRIYGEAFNDAQKGQIYCEKTLLGIALLILDEGNDLTQHHVSVNLQNENGFTDVVHFKKAKSDKWLFSLSKQGNDSEIACLYSFTTMKGDRLLPKKNLQLHLDSIDNIQLPYLKPVALGEFEGNPTFNVYGFSYGAGSIAWKEGIENFITKKGQLNQPSLLSTVFTALIIGQWQFVRIDESANKLLLEIRSKKNFYSNRANEARLPCTRTQVLEIELQRMQLLDNKSVFLLSRIRGALRTLEINAGNLATRLEQIRQTGVEDNYLLNISLESDFDKIKWSVVPDDDRPLLEIFQLNIQRLKDHQAYIKRHALYLKGLQDRWRLYLNRKQVKIGEYLATIVSVLVFLVAGNGIVTVNRRWFGLNFDESHKPLIYTLVIGIFLLPVLWYFTKWLVKFLCCAFYGTWFEKYFCKYVKKVIYFEFFNRLNKPEPRYDEEELK